MQLEEEIVKRIYSKKTIKKYEQKDLYLSNKKNSYNRFLLIKLFINTIIFIISFILLGRHLSISLILTIIINYLYIYFKYDKPIKDRNKLLESDASLFFEILLITLRSGKNLNEALELTVNNVDNELSNEFKEVIDETKYGKSLPEALIDFKEKILSDNIKDIITDLNESYLSGREMASYLEKDISLLNNKRIYDIKAYINKLPIKISVISVFILIPLMLLLILSPVILEYFS